MSTPNTNLQTYWHKGISHVMSVTIFFICLTSAISAYSAAQNFSLTSCTETMAKRVQEQEGEDRIVAKSKPTTMNLAFIVSTGSSAVQNLVASQSSGILKALCRKDWLYTGKPDAREFNRDAASSSQCTRRLVAPEEDQQHLNFPEESKSTRRLLASGSSETKGREKNWPHNHHISTNYVPHMEKFFSILRPRYGLGPMDQVENLDVNTAVWWKFLSAAQKAAVHLGTDFTENLRSTRNQPKKSLRQLFQLTQKLITDQTEITGITTIDWQQPMWRETTLLTDRAVQFATAKTYVFSDSVLCLGGISTEPVKAWESMIKWFMETFFEKNWIGSMENWWNSSGKYHQDSQRWEYCWIKLWTWALQRKDHLHVDVQWHW